MEIRTRLTLQFIAVVSLIIFTSFSVIYYSSSAQRRKELYGRLENKANTSAEMFISVQQIDSTMLRIFDATQKDKLLFENISIYDFNDTEVYTNNDTITFDVPKSLLKEIREGGKREFTQNSFEILGIPYVKESKKFVVLAGAIDTPGLKKLANLKKTLAMLFLVTIVVVAVTGWLYSGRALRPLTNIVNEVETFDADRLSLRLKQGKYNDEIGRLTATFNTLLDRLENVFSIQKLFLTGASHELKNPLTMITSQLQIAMQKRRNLEEYEQIIASTLEEIKQLNRTTYNLIEFASLSYEGNIQFAKVRVDDIIWSCNDYINRTFPDYKINISLQNMPENEDELILNGNEGLLKVAFLNLIDNACKFSHDKSCDIILETDHGKIEVRFKDRGIGFGPDQQKLIFEPFYRTDSTSDIKGHGIGLALTKKILSLHGAEIEVSSLRGIGSEFKIRFG